MLVKINGNDYIVNQNEYKPIHHNEYNNLRLCEELDIHEILIGFIRKTLKLNNFTKCYNKFIHINPSHGGFILYNLDKSFDRLFFTNINQELHLNNIEHNLKKTVSKNIFLENGIEEQIYNSDDFLIILNDDVNKNIFNLSTDKYIIISKIKLNNSEFKYIFYETINYHIYISPLLEEKFNEIFKFYIVENEKQNILNYENLLHLCIMVKNAGPQFKDMLEHNIKFCDKWTILDTGSTDETIKIINDILVGKKDGDLYEEPFINFKDSRNRLLDLAGTECKFIVMLDDTYMLEGDIRTFLKEVRSDQYSNSFTLYVLSDDTKYGSNRIIKSETGLRYRFRIHEVITDYNNINVVIPENRATILDKRFDYMEERTMNRKELDLKLLYEEVNDNPNEPRNYYYLAQTYNLLQDYEKAFEFYIKRASFTNSGFIQERIDAIFEAARIANFKLNKPWVECEKLYLEAFKTDESRPDAIYFIGIHYYMENNLELAHNYLKTAFEIGFPVHCQYSLKPTLSYFYVPKFLSKTSYIKNDYETGYKCCKLFLENNTFNNTIKDDYEEIVSWYKIYEKLLIYNGPKEPRFPIKPILCFVADGGFTSWTGENILTTGVGGSETYIIEMAKYLSKTNYFGDVIVFCNTPNKQETFFEGTRYIHLDYYYQFINTTYVHTVIISRYSEYLPLTLKGYSENVYLVVHDLITSGIVIPSHPKFKNIFCLTEWHTSYFTSIFPVLKSITKPLYYGIDENNFMQNSNKIKYKFIYSSFPNRGLLQLLQMWPTIYNKFPSATLYIYSDVNNNWSNQVEPQKMEDIRKLLNQYSNNYGIYYKGWVSKKELADSWATADIWFYPCTFAETFCLTALEAASSKTFAVTNGLAALQNTVCNRGVIINGDPNNDEWKDKALQTLFYYMDDKNKQIKDELIEKNYQWALELTWKNQAEKLFNNYIKPNSIYEYKNKYNWTNNFPEGQYNVIINILNYFNNNYWKIQLNKQINILEVGTYTGTSLIHLVQNIPYSKGTGVDLWINYNQTKLPNNRNSLQIKESFYKNIEISGLKDKINGLNINTKDALINFIKDKNYFDFIYINTSELFYDNYLHIILSWEILEKNGILTIDYKTDNTLPSQSEQINYFLHVFEGKYKLLNSDYYIILEKI